MTVQQSFRRIAQASVAAGNVVSMELPKVGYLGAIEIHGNIALTTSSGAITIVDATLGGIPLITRAQLVLDGRTVPLDISGKFLDYWSHIDRPGSERLALSSTVSADQWDFVLRFELAQAIANLTGALPLANYASARLEITFGAVTLIGTGTGIAVAGTVDIYGEMYDQNRPVIVDTSVVHTLRAFTTDIASSGDKNIAIPKGRALERLLLVAENSGAYAWDLVDALAFRMAPGDEPYSLTTPVFRARQLRHYGGDDVPITGLYVLDFRQAGSRDIVPLGDPRMAPDPELVATISSVSLSSAKLHVILEELEPVAAAA